MTRKRFIDAHRLVAALNAHGVELAPGKVCRGALALFAAIILVPKYLLAPSSREAMFTVSPVAV